MSRSCRLSAMAMVNALGREADVIWPRLLTGDQSHLRTRDDLVPDRSLLVAEVAGALPSLPSNLRRYACRNNALSLLAGIRLEQGDATPGKQISVRYQACDETRCLAHSTSTAVVP